MGGLATAVDLLSLILMVSMFGMEPKTANVPSLLAGAGVQFVGNRHFVFGAKGTRLQQQLMGFFAVEIAAFFLNAMGFYAMVTWTTVPYALARPLVSFAVFGGFSYPLWTLVFRKQTA